ncbi:MAG: asparagine synthase (glutamine-hydrolyzing) [Nitrospirales bacterium]|nr:asparagine synthase (glutamine-hydrolyzing) [Nitrospira sp.]MDR4502114.1 asparagine synthase (glutamine-hydrolyzing) [Nitrospirales bacterium]
MCGIAGRYNFISGAPVQEEGLRKMCRLLAHRGPDGQGTYQQDELGLGHRRLAVIDLTDAAQQPMVSGNGQYVMTYNGEVYNFPELRKNLEGLGHQFRSQSDTEVVLVAYQEYGVNCIEYLRGMFAFAIWDAHERRLFLARDRVGKKPLYYRVHQDGISFASEPKAFLGEPDFRPEVNLEGVAHYLTYQYVPAPHSAFLGVQKLPPAHCLIVQDGKISVKRYWKLSYSTLFPGSFEDAQQELLEKLKEAIRLRLVSDVPLGAFLSGGIDSSVVVALMAQLGLENTIQTFSIGFEQQEYNELAYARQVSEQYGTDHQEFVVTPQATEIFDKLVWFYNEPFADSSAIPTFYLAEMTRKYVTVALNGDGGDENLFGYDRYVASMYGTWFDRMPQSFRQLIKRGTKLIPEPQKTKTILGRMKRFAAVLSETPDRRYGHWICHFDPLMKKQICTEDFIRESGVEDSLWLLSKVFHESDAKDFLSQIVDADVNMYLPDDLLVKVDISTMAHGLEARSPFLDHQVMEFCASLPSSMKLKGSAKKYLLKKATKDLLPSNILNRPKMGFGVPIDHWLRNELRDVAYDVLLSSRFANRGFFKTDVVERLLKEHVKKEKVWHYQLWNLLMLELWCRMFLDREWTLRHSVV